MSDGEGTAVSLTLTATGTGQFTYLITPGSLPNGLDLVGDRVSGTILNGAAQGGTNGVYSITITATDSGGSAPASFTWTVTDPPRTIGALGPRSDAENTAVSLGVTGSDPDGDSITYSATGLPAGVGISASTGLVSGTITNSAAQGGSGGVYAVTVYVKDAWGSASNLFYWTVTDPNPVVTPVES